jgi:hypothetical protein
MSGDGLPLDPIQRKLKEESSVYSRIVEPFPFEVHEGDTKKERKRKKQNQAVQRGDDARTAKNQEKAARDTRARAGLIPQRTGAQLGSTEG